MSISVTKTGLEGLQASRERINKVAERIANPPANSDTISDIVELKSETTNFKANAAVIKVGQELEDTILDIIA